MTNPPTEPSHCNPGQSVFLRCHVDHPIDDQTTVSWFRGTGDLQLLTLGDMTIIQDERFVARRGRGLRDNEWALQIHNLDKSTDSGLYQCQTNDVDPPRSQYYQLNVVEPQVSILGAPDLAVKLGAAINLTCLISPAAEEMQFVFWYRDERMINYDFTNEQRGKLVMSKMAATANPAKYHGSGSGVGASGDLVVASNLQIFHSKLSDSGNYTCAPSGTRSTSIYVHILEANDKRLIMFQNDADNNLLTAAAPAASHQQTTNSALSTHVVRLTRGSAYSLFVGYVILANWLQLIGHPQTCISLALLAIIGLFLSNATDGRAGPRAAPDGKLAASDPTGQLADDSVDEDELATSSSKKLLHDDDDDDEQQQQVKLEANGAEDKEAPSRETLAAKHQRPRHHPLIERAHSALDQLKSLNSETESLQTSDDDDHEHEHDQDHDGQERDCVSRGARLGSRLRSSRRPQPDLVRLRLMRPKIERTSSSPASQPGQHHGQLVKPLTSPSASSSSSSSNSTGYNSDSRQTRTGTPTPSLLADPNTTIGSTWSDQQPRRPLDDDTTGGPRVLLEQLEGHDDDDEAGQQRQVRLVGGLVRPALSGQHSSSLGDWPAARRQATCKSESETETGDHNLAGEPHYSTPISSSHSAGLAGPKWSALVPQSMSMSVSVSRSERSASATFERPD